MDENRFELSLEEVDCKKCAYESLETGRFRNRLVEVEVNIRPQDIKDQCRDDKWAEILDDVDGSPSCLRALKQRQS